jgi:uncharacterized ion transporter superfamily protein YfcC
MKKNIIIVILTVLTLISWIYAYSQKVRAEHVEKISIEMKEDLELHKDSLEVARQNAEAARQRAELEAVRAAKLVEEVIKEYEENK